MGRFGALKIPPSKECASAPPKLVGVIASQEELRAAGRMRRPPALFELRLDYLPALDPKGFSKLRRPLIITARHPAEGGKEIDLDRGELLAKFLPSAQWLDLELRSLRELQEVWHRAERLKLKRICSVHDFAQTPSHSILQKQFQRAKRARADIFKLVTRADTPDDLITLLEFLRRTRSRCCVMAIGKFGPISRLLFPEFGSVLIYAPLRRPLHPGQLTLDQWRRMRDFYAKT